MTDIKLINIKIDKDKDNTNYTVYRPKYSEKDKYKIIFKSKKPIFIQFNIYAKFINLIEIVSKESINKFEIFPYEGISYSCLIDKDSDLVINIEPIDLCTKIIIKDKLENLLNDTKMINITWSNIFIINLARRNDRKENMIKKLAKANITNYEFIEAYDGQDPEIYNKYIELKNKKNIPIVTSGHFACLLSHIKAISLAKKNNYNNIMILEDDVFFCDNFIDELQKMLIPEFDMLYLGAIMKKKKLFCNKWIFNNKNKVMGAYAYIISHRLYDVILEKLMKYEEYVDVLYLKDIQKNYKTIILNDLIKTDLVSSDTSSKSKKMIKRLEFINK
jgi:GR25 family glycosyltransferase involved in LPS biosynthesis